VLKYFMMVCAILMTTVANAQKYAPSLPIDHVNSKASSVEVNVREAAVRVSVPITGGHGSGSYIKYKDIHLVITAQHVVDGALGGTYLVSHKQESRVGILIYADPASDIGILYLGNSFKSIEPMKYNPIEGVSAVGTDVFYSGYPSDHKLMSFDGKIAGYEYVGGGATSKRIILHTYGWFGCSGSVIYNTRGQQVGVLYGVDVEYRPTMQVQENMIWVVPMRNLKMEKALGAFCRGYQGRKLKACK